MIEVCGQAVKCGPDEWEDCAHPLPCLEHSDPLDSGAAWHAVVDSTGGEPTYHRAEDCEEGP